MRDTSGWDERLGYVRWLRNRGRVEPESDGEVAEALGVSRAWFSKWKARKKLTNDLSFAETIAGALAPMGVARDWLFYGDGAPPEPKLWEVWRQGTLPAADAAFAPVKRKAKTKRASAR